VDLTVASEQDSTFSAAHPDRLLTIDLDDPRRAVEQVRVFADEYPVSAVFGIDDGTAVIAAHVSRALGLPHSSVAAAETAGDKHRQRVALRESGVPVPGFALVDVSEDPARVAGSFQYPCVVKPLALSASRGVIRVDDPEAFVRAFGRLRAILSAPDVRGEAESSRHILVEEFVAGPEFAVEGLMEDGHLRVLALFDKPDPLDGPFFAETIYVTPSRHSGEVQEAVTRCAGSAARAIGLTEGPVHIEVRHNDRGPWLIELAARPIGGKCGQVLRFGADGAISFEQVLLSRALGELTALPDREPAAAAVMMVPVPIAGVVRDIGGVEDALAIRHVSDVIVTVHRGQRVAPLPEEARYMAFILARGPSPDEVEWAVRRGHELLNVVIEPDP